MASKLPPLAKPPDLSLYLHLPFCSHKCAYCDFFSVVTGDAGYMERVAKEIVLQARAFLDLLQPGRIPSIYLGGGTPSCVPRPILRLLLIECRRLWAGRPQEFTVEANPESLDGEFIALCREFGVTRLSVGIQTLNPRLRRVLGRAGGEHLKEKISWLADKWQGDLNLDLLAGIPGQDLGDLGKDLEIILRFRPAHVSFYMLTLEPGTALARQVKQGRISWPSRELQDELWLGGRAALVKNGYSHYEISNFALPRKECRHNLRYWLLLPYLGVGPSAVSTLILADGRVVRLANPRQIGEFLAGKDAFWRIGREIITPPKLFFEQLMLGLRLQSGIPRDLFLKRYQKELPEVIPELWASWQKRRLLKKSGNRYALTLRGRLILNLLLSEVLEYEKQYKDITFNWR